VIFASTIKRSVRKRGNLLLLPPLYFIVGENITGANSVGV